MMMRLFPSCLPAACASGRALSRAAARALRASARRRRATRWLPCSLPPPTAPYFEHAFLAQQMGVELVEGMDLS